MRNANWYDIITTCLIITDTGNNTLDDLMVHLIHTVELFRQQLDADIAEEVSQLEKLVVQIERFVSAIQARMWYDV